MATNKKKTTKKTTSKTGVKKTPAKKAPARKSGRMTASANASTTKTAASKPAKAKRLSGLDIVAKVLAGAKEPLNAKAIAERAMAAGWKTSGKTPHATLYAAMIREISAKGSESRFKKADRGMFTATTSAKKEA